MAERDDGFYFIKRKGETEFEPAEWEKDGWFLLTDFDDTEVEVGPRIFAPDEEIKFKQIMAVGDTLHALDDSGVVWLLQDDDWIKISNPKGSE